MTTADLIAAAAPAKDRPAWAFRGAPYVLGIRVAAGDIATAAKEIDVHAALRGLSIFEVARVDRDGIEVILARGQPAPNPT